MRSELDYITADYENAPKNIIEQPYDVSNFESPKKVIQFLEMRKDTRKYIEAVLSRWEKYDPSISSIKEFSKENDEENYNVLSFAIDAACDRLIEPIIFLGINERITPSFGFVVFVYIHSCYNYKDLNDILIDEYYNFELLKSLNLSKDVNNFVKKYFCLFKKQILLYAILDDLIIADHQGFALEPIFKKNEYKIIDEINQLIKIREEEKKEASLKNLSLTEYRKIRDKDICDLLSSINLDDLDSIDDKKAS